MFYKVEVESSLGSDTWKNVFYYENGEDEILGALAYKGADEVAERFVDKVVPAFLGVYHHGVRVDKVTVYPFDDNFHIVTFLPYVKFVGLNGNFNNLTDWLPPEQGLLIRFNLEPVSRFDFSQQPKRGRIFLSGVSEGFFDVGHLAESIGDESIPGTMRSRLRNFCNKIAEKLDNPVLPDFMEVGEYNPVRAKSHKLLGVWKIVGYSRVIDADYSKRVYYLRSRRE